MLWYMKIWYILNTYSIWLIRHSPISCCRLEDIKTVFTANTQNLSAKVNPAGGYCSEKWNKIHQTGLDQFSFSYFRSNKRWNNKMFLKCWRIFIDFDDSEDGILIILLPMLMLPPVIMGCLSVVDILFANNSNESFNEFSYPDL